MPKKLIHLVVLGLFLLPLLGFPGCQVKKTERLPAEKVLSLQTATLEELLQRLEQQQKGVTSLHAVAELVPSTGSAYSGVIEQYHDVRAIVLAQRQPGGEGENSAAAAPHEQIRMLAQSPIVRKTIFDMVADDHEFRISLPSKNKFIVGPARLERRSEKPIENLRPQHLLEALFFQAPWPETPVVLEENEVGGRRYYVVSELIVDDAGTMLLHRKWWFERSALDLERVQRFGPGGALVTDIHYGQWQDTGGLRYPREIELVRPRDDYRLKLTIKELTLNEPLAAEKFRLEKPEGAELVELKEKPAGESESPK